jgi:pimeloyl-[acyl-carrier protein] synthase
MTQPFAFNPFSPEFVADPYPFYQKLREIDPVHFMPAANGYFLTRYADVAAVLKDNRFGRELPANPAAHQELPEQLRPLFAMFGNWMLFRDPPNHTRLRGLVNKAFTPRVVDGLRPHIQEIADELLDEMAADGGPQDLIARYAFPLPVIVIAQMLGVPATDRTLFKDWSSVLARAIDANPSPEELAQGAHVAQQVADYLRDVVNERRRAPKEDLISGLIAAEEQGQKLTEDELLATCVLLLVAGHETTVNLIANGTLTLLRHPAALAQLRATPDLIVSAVEELLRFESPVQSTSRYALQDVELGGKLIRQGQQVIPVLAAANRDPAVFANPDQLDLARPNNQHLAFAAGIHYCVGAPLARAEGQIALGALFQRFANLALATEQVEWRQSLVFRGMRALPVRF